MDNLVGALILLALYFLPSIVAVARSHRQLASILVINFFLGWTVVGWIVALAMAVGSSDRRESSTVVVQTSATGAVYQAGGPDTAPARPTLVASTTASAPSGDRASPQETPHEHKWADAEATNQQTGEVVPLRRCTACGFIEARPQQAHSHAWGDPVPGDEGRLYQECAGCAETRYIG